MFDLAIVLTCYALFWIARIRFVARRLAAPFNRGDGWLFDRRLREGWTNEASQIVKAYRLRMAWAFAIDVPILWIIFVGREYVLSVLLIVLGCVIQELNHIANVGAAMRRAEAKRLTMPVQRPRSLMLSLKPRRLRDYMLPHVELTIAVCDLMAVAWLGIIEARFGAPNGLWALFGVPFFLLYVQLGALLAKWMAIEWRSSVSVEFAQREASASEALRKHRALVCDVMRAAAAMSLLFWPIRVALGKAETAYAVAIFFACAVVVTGAVAFRKEQRRRELESLLSRLPPAATPEIAMRPWPVCLAPSSPLLVLPSYHGWSINIAHRQSQVAVIYVAGFIALATRLALG